jgi:hypothetical protein
MSLGYLIVDIDRDYPHTSRAGFEGVPCSLSSHELEHNLMVLFDPGYPGKFQCRASRAEALGRGA